MKQLYGGREHKERRKNEPRRERNPKKGRSTGAF